MNLSIPWLWKINPKERTLIFGTGAGASHFYHSIKKQKNVIAFLDNNTQKQGTYFFGKKIHSPEELSKFTFDKIIIASDYYQEIYQQLTENLNIDGIKIDIFHAAPKGNPPFLDSISDKLEIVCKKLLCHPFSLISFISYHLITKCSHYFTGTRIVELSWLDKNIENKVHTFRKAQEVISYGPKFIGASQRTKRVSIPELGLYKFNHAQMMTMSGTIITENNNVITIRVPSANIKTADYASGHITFHNKEKAIMKTLSPTHIEKGIAITAYNDLNYYHWLIEVLSKIQFLSELPSEYSDYPILISQQLTNIKNIETFFNYFNIKNPIIYLNSNHAYQVGELLLITPPNYIVANLKGNHRFQISSSYYSTESLSYLRHVALSNIKKSISYENIFLARKNYIRNYNQDSVQALLIQYGFTPIYLEDLTFDEQVSVINSAKYIVGPTGAAWTNLLFAQKGAKALCWMAKEYGDISCFSNIAKNSEVQLDYLEYITDAKNTRELYYKPYTVDIKKIKQWLDENIP